MPSPTSRPCSDETATPWSAHRPAPGRAARDLSPGRAIAPELRKCRAGCLLGSMTKIVALLIGSGELSGREIIEQQLLLASIQAVLRIPKTRTSAKAVGLSRLHNTWNVDA